MIDVRGSAFVFALIALNAISPAAAQSPDAAKSPMAQSVAKPSVQARTLEVRDISFGAPGVGPSIGRMVFGGFRRDVDRVHADRIDLQNVVLKFATQTTTIPAVVISSVDLPEALFRALTEGNASADWAGLLVRTAIDHVTIERVMQSELGDAYAVRQQRHLCRRRQGWDDRFCTPGRDQCHRARHPRIARTDQVERRRSPLRTGELRGVDPLLHRRRQRTCQAVARSRRRRRHRGHHAECHSSRRAARIGRDRWPGAKSAIANGRTVAGGHG